MTQAPADDMRLIDVHAHCVPVSALAQVRSEPGRHGVWWEPFEDVPQLRVGNRLIRPLFESMTRERAQGERSLPGDSREVLSVWPDLLAYDLPVPAAREWHDIVNEGLAALAGPSTGSAWLACLSAQDPEVAADELRTAVAKGASGGLLGSNVNRQGLDVRAMDVLWATASELRRPLFIHPLNPATDGRATVYNLRALTCYLAETTLAIASMILSGVYDRFPDLQLVVAHGGATLPYQIGRIDKGHRLIGSHSATCLEPPSAYLPLLHFDSITHSAASLDFLLAQVGHERVMLGTDHPFGIGADVDTQLEHLRDLPAEVSRAILFDNASRLFGIK